MVGTRTRIPTLMGIIYVNRERRRQRRSRRPKTGPVTITKADGSSFTLPAYSRNAIAQVKGTRGYDPPRNVVVGEKKWAPCEICGGEMGIGETWAGAFLYCSHDPSHFTERFKQNYARNKDNRKKRKGGISTADGAVAGA